MPKDMEGLRTLGVVSPPPKGWRGIFKTFDGEVTMEGAEPPSQQK